MIEQTQQFVSSSVCVFDKVCIRDLSTTLPLLLPGSGSSYINKNIILSTLYASICINYKYMLDVIKCKV